MAKYMNAIPFEKAMKMAKAHSKKGLLQALPKIVKLQYEISIHRQKLDEHDCHAGPEDGCECEKDWFELAQRVRELDKLAEEMNG